MGMASAASSFIDAAVHSLVSEELMLIEYSRSDAEFETCLATEPSLRACLDKLHCAGHRGSYGVAQRHTCHTKIPGQPLVGHWTDSGFQDTTTGQAKEMKANETTARRMP